MFYEPLWEYQQYQLVKRPDTPNIYITWCKPGSSEYQRKSTRTSDLAKAQEILIEYVRDRDRPTRTEPHEVSILDCLVDYVERKIATKAHWTAERTALKHWMAFTKKEDLVVVSDLTLKMQEHFIEWRRASLMKKNGRASNATINRDLDVIRAALRDAWKQARLTHPPFITSLPNPRPRERTLSPQEHAALIDACTEPHLHLFVMLATHTLQRPGAILELRIEQVDLERGIIDFHKPGEADTNKRRAVVPISTTLRPHIEQAISNSQSGYVIERNGERVKEGKAIIPDRVQTRGPDRCHPVCVAKNGRDAFGGFWRAATADRRDAWALHNAHDRVSLRQAPAAVPRGGCRDAGSSPWERKTGRS